VRRGSPRVTGPDKGETNELAGLRSWATHGKKEREREAGLGWGKGFGPREV
jgi:hypothetical protein